MRNWTPFLAGLLVVAAPSAAATRQIEESFPARPDSAVELELVAGTVRFVGWDKDELRITGTINDETESLEIDHEGGYFEIEVELDTDRRRSSGPSASLEIHLPRRSRIEAESISAPVRIEGVGGSIEVETISGEIEIRGPLTQVDLASISGRVRVETATPLDLAEIETVSGDVTFRGPLASRARLSVESVNGRVELELPADLSAQVDVETFNGSIDNDFGCAAERTSEYLPARHLSCKLGGGAARIAVESFNGPVRLSKR